MEDPLTNISENNKRPTILYIIIGVLIAIIIVLIIVIAVKKCDDCDECPKCKCEEPSPYNTDHFIKIKESFYTDRIEGSKALQGELNHLNSPYFKMVDVYNMVSNENRTIFSKFKTYQQTSEVSSQCAALIMALEYYGEEAPSERDCMMNFAKIDDPDNFVEDSEFDKKLDMKSFENYINSIGYTTTSNDDFTEENFPYSDSESFSKWAREILKKNETILVNWADWGGTCSIIIGVDTMGNESPEDQVIILADSYDTCDHLNDGYYIIGLDKFYYNWDLNSLYYLKDDEEKKKYATGRFIIIHRKNSN